MNKLDNIEKVCAFYVSNAHLSTMIMPYISKQIEDNNIIETFFENNIEKDIEIILSKIILNEKNKEKIKKINWKNTKFNDIKIKKIINNYNEKNKKNNNLIINILINGKNEYIEKINNLLKNIINNINLKNNIKIRIINCYLVEQTEENIINIIKENNYLLNTAGLKQIDEIYENKNLAG